ncbi:MAG: hypothetical protein AAFU61_05270 [Pseudomonadota bacterium]
MARRLILHCLPPDGPGCVLQRRFLDAALPQRARVELSDPMHQSRSRWPEGLPEPLGPVRLLHGPTPFGYFDGLSAPVLHVMVLGDPADAFVRFAQRLMLADAQEVRAAAGAWPDEAAAADLDSMVDWLLDQSLVRRTRLGAATRLTAGAPLISGGAEAAEMLPAARANLSRVNLLIGLEGRLDAFAQDLSEVMGWTPPFQEVESKAAASPGAEALGASVRARLAAATAADRALLGAAEEAVREDA